jgi:hypothetical protein
MEKKLYSTPETEEVSLFIDRIVLQSTSNTEGIGGGTDD